MKHTKGPWHFNSSMRINGLYGVNAVCEQNGFVNPMVAEILTDHCIDREAHANARLIAAAPDLLEACQLCMAADSRWGDKMRQAIQKATAPAEG